MKIRLVRAEFHAVGDTDRQTDGRTDGRTDTTTLIVAFRNFGNSPKKGDHIKTSELVFLLSVITM
jgi:hypothetical protein